MQSYRPVRPLAKHASVRLPSDPQMWADVIYEHVGRTHPYLAHFLQGDIDWSDEPVDEETGNASGYIMALIGRQPLRIPVVVRDFDLKPIDVFMTPDGEIDVIDRDLLMSYADLQPASVGQKIDPWSEESSWSGSMLGKVSSYADAADDLKRAAGYVREDYPVLSDAMDRLQGRVGSSGTPYDTLLVERSQVGVKLSAFRGGRRTDVMHVSDAEAFYDPKSKLAMAARRSKDGAVILIGRELDKEAVTEVDDAVDGDIVLEDGTRLDGVLAKVSSFSGREQRVVFEKTAKEAEEGSTTNENASEAITDRGVVRFARPGRSRRGPGVATSDHVPSFKDLESDLDWKSARRKAGEITEGQQVLVATKEAAYGPAEVMSRYRSADGTEVVRLKTAFDGNVKIALSKAAQRLLPAGESTYLVPESASFHVLEQASPATMSPESAMVAKLASDGLGTVDLRESRGTFRFRCGDVDEVYNRFETKAALMSLGATDNSASSCVKTAESRSVLRVYGVERPASSSTAPRMNPAAEAAGFRAFDTWTKRRDSVLKLASIVQDEDMQDGLAAMSMMNQYNATRFAEALQEIEQAKRVTARLLIEIRKGNLDGVDEGVAKEGMNALQAITKGLSDVVAASS